MKIFKRIGALLAAAVLALGMGTLAACNNGDDGDGAGAGNGGTEARTDAYTIYVKDASGNAIANVQIGICKYNKTTGQKSTCYAPKTTDANGKVEFDANDNIAEDVYALNTDLFEDTYEAQTLYVFEAYGVYTVVLAAK